MQRTLVVRKQHLIIIPVHKHVSAVCKTAIVRALNNVIRQQMFVVMLQRLIGTAQPVLSVRQMIIVRALNNVTQQQMLVVGLQRLIGMRRHKPALNVRPMILVPELNNVKRLETMPTLAVLHQPRYGTGQIVLLVSMIQTAVRALLVSPVLVFLSVIRENNSIQPQDNVNYAQTGLSTRQDKETA